MVGKKITISGPILAELIAIKRLLVFALMKNGASQNDIAPALGLDRSQISRMFPKGGSGRTRAKKG